MTELKLSAQWHKQVEKILAECVKELSQEMVFGSIDHMKISLDLNVDGGKFAGVKYSAFKAERLEKIYDMDRPK